MEKRLSSPEMMNAEHSKVEEYVIEQGRELERLLLDASERLGLTARAFDRVLRVARTIADVEASERVMFDHVAEALQYRGKAVTGRRHEHEGRKTQRHESKKDLCAFRSS